MYKITIKKDLIVSNEAQFESMQLLNSWKDRHVEMGTFQFEDIEVPAKIDQWTNEEISPAHILSKTHTFEIIDITSQEEIEAAKQAKIEAGKKAREICQSVLDLVAGYNLDRELTLEQITQMQTTFANAEAALRAGRPTYAKIFISAITADEVLVTQEMKNLCLELLEGY